MELSPTPDHAQEHTRPQGAPRVPSPLDLDPRSQSPMMVPPRSPAASAPLYNRDLGDESRPPAAFLPIPTSVPIVPPGPEATAADQLGPTDRDTGSEAYATPDPVAAELQGETSDVRRVDDKSQVQPSHEPEVAGYQATIREAVDKLGHSPETTGAHRNGSYVIDQVATDPETGASMVRYAIHDNTGDIAFQSPPIIRHADGSHDVIPTLTFNDNAPPTEISLEEALATMPDRLQRIATTANALLTANGVELTEVSAEPSPNESDSLPQFTERERVLLDVIEENWDLNSDEVMREVSNRLGENIAAAVMPTVSELAPAPSNVLQGPPEVEATNSYVDTPSAESLAGQTGPAADNLSKVDDPQQAEPPAALAPETEEPGNDTHGDTEAPNTENALRVRYGYGQVPAVIDELQTKLRQRVDKLRESDPSIPESAGNLASYITPRRAEYLALHNEGKTNEEIQAAMGFESYASVSDIATKVLDEALQRIPPHLLPPDLPEPSVVIERPAPDSFLADLNTSVEQSGLKPPEIAASLEWSLSKLYRILNGTVGISHTDLQGLAQTLGIEPERAAALVDKWREDPDSYRRGNGH